MKSKLSDSVVLDEFLKKHKLTIGVVEDMSDHVFKMAIVFNTADKKTGIDSMTERKIRDFLASIIDDRQY
jgi:hypothetical protein